MRMNEVSMLYSGLIRAKICHGLISKTMVKKYTKHLD